MLGAKRAISAASRRCTGVSSAKFCFLMQMSTKLCRTLHRFAEAIMVTNGSHWRRRWQDGRGSRSFLPEHSETFQSISKHFVTSRCHLLRIDWAARVGLRTETRVSLAGRRSLSYRWRLGETKAAAPDQHGCPLCACRANFTTHEAVKAPRPQSSAPQARP